MLRKFFYYLFHDPKHLVKTFIVETWVALSPMLSRELYLRVKFRLEMGYKLNLQTPKTYSEKLQWLKLYAYKPEYSDMVDKVKAKEYVASIIGEKYIIPTLGVWEKAEDIDFNELPEQFVLKCNHNAGGGMCICTDKSKLDIDSVRKGLNKGLRQNYYHRGKDLPYKYVERRILAEKYLVDDKTCELRDYKFFCFDGDVKALFVATGRQKKGSEVCFDFFDADYNHLPVKQKHPNALVIPEKPSRFEDMKLLASKLSKGIPQVRIDLYEANGEIYFGEMTFYHFGGDTPYDPIDFDYKMGEWIKLPEKTNFLKNSK